MSNAIKTTNDNRRRTAPFRRAVISKIWYQRTPPQLHETGSSCRHFGFVECCEHFAGQQVHEVPHGLQPGYASPRSAVLSAR
jgi:hypothetical protein